ncbi:MAG: hypothetical protein ACI8P9_003132 [Parasphingorhabdus sp.]|jgi:hypothetical protein
MLKKAFLAFAITFSLAGCGIESSSSEAASVVDLDTSPSSAADARSSYENSKANIIIRYSALPRPAGTGDLSDAIAYLDADGDGDTDVFLATGEYLLDGEVNSVLALNDGVGNFTSSTAEFGDSMPPATHARKSIVSDFNNDSLQDILVFDHGFDSDPFPGSQPKLIIQNSVGSFSWSKLTDQTGFHHGGAAADIDNDGDIDIFVGGNDPFFYVNDGTSNFTKADDRFNGSIERVFTAELIDVDLDGFVDLLVGAHERDGDQTSIYWGSSTGSYSSDLRTVIPTVEFFGVILDFDAEDIDSDGDRDLIINRTRDGDDGDGKGFYQGRTIQLLVNNEERSFADVTATNIDLPGGDDESWFPWVRAQDIDSDDDIDFGPDNADRGFFYENDGSGVFTRIAYP